MTSYEHRKSSYGLANGKVLFKLHGLKLAGLWELVRISKPGEKKQDQWILFKKKGDAWARPGTEYEVITAWLDSVTANPLGLVEEREPRDPPRAMRSPPPDTRTILKGAKKAALPAKLAPQLATLVSGVPAGDWVVETKFEGYRLLVRIEDGEVKLFTRNGHDWTSKLRPIANAVATLGLDSAFAEWTPEKHVRHAVFRGLRTDKPAGQIVRERPQAVPAASASPAPARKVPTASTMKVSNPERVIDPTTGLRKVDLVRRRQC